MDKLGARKKMLQHLKEMMRDSDDMGLAPALEAKKPMKKVMVASDTDEGLQHGLSKAEQILQKRAELMGDQDEEESSDESEHEELDKDEEVEEEAESMEDEAISMLEKAQEMEEEAEEKEPGKEDKMKRGGLARKKM